MIHYNMMIILLVVNGLFVGRACYLVWSKHSPITIDFWLRRLASYAYMLAIVSLVSYPLTTLHNSIHLLLLLLPAVLPFVLLPFRAYKEQYSLLHPLLHYFLIVYSFFFL